MSATHPHSPLRIFFISALATLISVVGVLIGKGGEAMVVTLVLIIIEVTFSFDNAILNAKVLTKMSPFWQTMFLTVGAAIAIFGMRIIFPILIVSLSAGLGWREVLDLALHHPEQYAMELEKAHPTLSAFGGAFLLLLALDFFANNEHQVQWLTRFERSFRKLAGHWIPPIVTLLVVVVLSWLPSNPHPHETLVAGIMGVVIYSLIHGLTEVFARAQQRRNKGKAGVYVGMAAFISFLYLEVLDATFSFDSVLGAFAVTTDIILIAIGLGVGALWVRSLTVFMVRRGTLGNYRFIEHGAHYTIGLLGCIFLIELFYDVPQYVTGIASIGIIVTSVFASRRANALAK